jgi:hypothetical protein
VLPKIFSSSGCQLLLRRPFQGSCENTHFGSRKEGKVKLSSTHFLSSHSLLPLASPRCTRYTCLPGVHHGTMASVHQRGIHENTNELTPSPSITSTSFGCVVPFLDRGIVRPSRCVIVLSKPSNACFQRVFMAQSLHPSNPPYHHPPLPLHSRFRPVSSAHHFSRSPHPPPFLNRIRQVNRLTSATLNTTLPTIPFSFLPQPPSPSFF